jgi:hypothetical protein
VGVRLIASAIKDRHEFSLIKLFQITLSSSLHFWQFIFYKEAIVWIFFIL